MGWCDVSSLLPFQKEQSVEFLILCDCLASYYALFWCVSDCESVRLTVPHSAAHGEGPETTTLMLDNAVLQSIVCLMGTEEGVCNGCRFGFHRRLSDS